MDIDKNIRVNGNCKFLAFKIRYGIDIGILPYQDGLVSIDCIYRKEYYTGSL